MRTRIATILVGHERPTILEALAKIDAFFEEKLPRAVRTTIVVDNGRPRVDHERLGDDRVLVGGDNSLREFSAWDRGIATLDRMRETPDFVHFATSAFDALYVGYLDAFAERMLDSARDARAVLGHVDYYDEPVTLFGHASQQWVRTSFFFVPFEAVRALRSVVSFERPEQVFGDDPKAPFLLDAPISKRLQDYIRSWLTGEGTGQGVVWHSRFDLDAKTLPLFRTKALAILNEHLLSVRLRELGYPVGDILWLAGQLAEHPGEPIDWHRPWTEQIAERPK